MTPLKLLISGWSSLRPLTPDLLRFLANSLWKICRNIGHNYVCYLKPTHEHLSQHFPQHFPFGTLLVSCPYHIPRDGLQLLSQDIILVGCPCAQ